MFSVALIAKRFMIRAFWAAYLCLTLILFPLPSFALKIQDVPNPLQDSGGWVTDLAQILSPDTEAKLNQIISELEDQTGNKIAVVTVPETTPAPSPKAFTTKLFNYWDIGKNDEVLFLVSKGDRRIEIQTSYAIESMLPDAQVSDIIKKEIIPQFRQGNFEGGILTGTKSLVTKLGGNLASLQNLALDTENTANSNQQSGYIALGILVIAALVLPSFWYFSSIGRRGDVRDVGGGDSGGAAGGD